MMSRTEVISLLSESKSLAKKLTLSNFKAPLSSADTEMIKRIAQVYEAHLLRDEEVRKAAGLKLEELVLLLGVRFYPC